MGKIISAALVVVAAIGVVGCAARDQGPGWPIEPPVVDYNRPLPPGELALRKITDPGDLPDFSAAFAHQQHLRDAVANSLSYLARPSSQTFFPYGEITHARAVASLTAFVDVLDQTTTPGAFDAMLRERFDVYISVGCDDVGTVLYTGYYCPIFDARTERDARFRYPLHRRPGDLVKDPGTAKTVGRRTPDGQVVPYYTRAEIDAGALADGEPIAWLADRFEAYVVSVQGSGRLRMADGSIMEVGFAGDNGYDYVSVAKVMVADGVIDERDLSLDAMIAYFKRNPDELDRYLAMNPRYVFFDKVSGGPYGCLNVPVLPMRSIATDKDIYPRACLAMVDARVASDVGGAIRETAYRAFVLDQDRGNAIRAPGRCDLFMGIGDAAGRVAGRTMAEGRLYYLFVKEP